MKSIYAVLKKIPEKATPRVIQSSQAPIFTIGNRKMLNLCSSHYLGFASDERLKKAAVEAIKTYGLGTGYRTIAGTHTLHVELESKLAAFKGTESAVIFPAGYLANMAAIQTIMTKEDVIISDELNHASIIDAIRLAGIQNKHIYKHADIDDLRRQKDEIQRSLTVLRSDGEKRRALIVTDGVFSMDGDLAPLPELAEFAEEIDAILMVDDAHGEGVLGKGGQGIVDHFNLHGRVDIEVGTLSKAFSVIGGFITGKKELIHVYKGYARQFMFTSAMTIPDTAALIEAVNILQESDEPIQKLWDNTRYLKDSLKQAGFDIGHSESPITPIMLGDEAIAQKFAEMLFEAGVYASAIVFPMVGKGSARIRLIPSAAHSRNHLDLALKEIIRIGKLLKII